MLFNSYIFLLVFLPITLFGCYYLARRRDTALVSSWLVLASLVFYGWWDFRYLPLLIGSISFNYAVSRYIAFRRIRGWLVFGIAADVALLFYCKYADFFLSTANDVLGTTLPLLHIVLPLGISFFTFTQIAYLIDTWRGTAHVRGFLYYAEFVTIFPHLIAGPILSYREMLPQFQNPKSLRPDWNNIWQGIVLFTIGLAKKVLVADSLSPHVARIFDNPGTASAPDAWLGALCYVVQLYFDFSGYSEMAMGLGLLINLRLPMNFDAPYQAANFIEFWRRWHMSLSFWVRDYLYIPLGGNQRGFLRKLGNIFLSMTVIGLWHGAAWTYVVWGMIQGCLVAATHIFRRLGGAMPRAVAWPLTFLCWILTQVVFRSASLGDAAALLRSMLLPWQANFVEGEAWVAANGGLLAALLVLLVLLAVLPPPERAIHHLTPSWPVAGLLAFLMAASFLSLTQPTEFLYFQF